MMKLSREEIASFCGAVLSLRISEGYESGEVTWSCSNDGVLIRQIRDCPEKAILSLVKEGRSTVFARYRGETAACEVTAREMVHANGSEEMNYYVGDLHVHTTRDHNRETFSDDSEKCIGMIKNEGEMDFSVISDHAACLSDRYFFNGMQDADIIALYFARSEQAITETNAKYGA